MHVTNTLLLLHTWQCVHLLRKHFGLVAEIGGLCEETLLLGLQLLDLSGDDFDYFLEAGIGMLL
jgi:hypothetical protein